MRLFFFGNNVILTLGWTEQPLTLLQHYGDCLHSLAVFSGAQKSGRPGVSERIFQSTFAPGSVM